MRAACVFAFAFVCVHVCMCVCVCVRVRACMRMWTGHTPTHTHILPWCMCACYENLDSAMSVRSFPKRLLSGLFRSSTWVISTLYYRFSPAWIYIVLIIRVREKVTNRSWLWHCALHGRQVHRDRWEGDMIVLYSALESWALAYCDKV